MKARAALTIVVFSLGIDARPTEAKTPPKTAASRPAPGASRHPSSPAAPRREIVIASEALALSGDRLPAQLDVFLRRVETLAGWPRQSLAGRAFVTPAEALAYLQKAKPRPAFAILPVHQFVQGRKPLELTVLGRAVGLEGAEPAFWVIARKDKAAFQHIEFTSGLRLAGLELDDNRWLSNVVFETNIQADKHFYLHPVPSAAAAVAALEKNEADVAVLYETEYLHHTERLKNEGDLVQVYSSGPVPAPPLVAVGSSATAADRKALVSILPKLCDGLAEGVSVHEACAHLSIMRIDAGHADTYDILIEKYDGAPPARKPKK